MGRQGEVIRELRFKNNNSNNKLTNDSHHTQTIYIDVNPHMVTNF
jgi:hypothetical protein